MKRILLLTVTHALAAVLGFSLGIYMLPILIAPRPPSTSEVDSAAGAATYKTEFRRGLKGSDFVHWGEGLVSITPRNITLKGRVAPGPDYKLYLAPQFVDTKDAFLRIKSQSARVGDVKTFKNFIVPVPEGIDVSRYTTVVVWCESFSMFITAAKYR